MKFANILFFLCFVFYLSGQCINVDSLLVLVKKIPTIDAKNEFYEIHINTLNEEDKPEFLLYFGKENIINQGYRQAIIILKLLVKNFSYINKIHFEAQYNLGYAQFANREYEKAIKTFYYVIQNSEDNNLKIFSTYFLCFTYCYIGEYKEASILIEQLKTEELINKSYEFLELERTISIGLQDYNKAIIKSNQIITTAKNDLQLLRGFYGKGIGLISLKKYKEAADSFLSSLKFQKKNDFNKLRTTNNLALVFRNLKDVDNFQKYSNISKSIIKEIINDVFHFEYSVYYQNLAEFHSDQGNFPLALKLIDSCIYHHCYGPAIKGTPENYVIDPLFVEDKISLILYLEVKLQILEKEGNTRLDNIYDILDEVIQNIRGESFDDQNRFIQQSNLSRFYKSAVNYFIQNENYHKAFYFTQKMKNIILLEKLHTNSLQKSLPENYLQKYQSFNDSISLISTSEDLSEIEISTKLETLKRGFIFLKNEIKEKFPAFHRQKFEVASASISTIQAQLTNEQIILDYYLDSSLIHVFLISSTDFKYHQIKVDSIFHRLFSNSNLEISQYPDILIWNAQKYQEFLGGQKILFNYLIPPIEAKYSELIIIPYDKLYYFPFETLVKNINNKCPYLICEKNISYANSVDLWYVLKNKKRSKNEKAFVFSPFENSQKDNYLKFASNESKLVSDILATDINFSLSKLDFIEKIKDAKYHHILTHLYIDNQDDAKSYISLGPEGNKILISDIVAQELDSEMVCLSACNSGIGSLIQGEGVVSMARAFLESGAKSIIMTNHSVPDESSSQIMRNFYQYLDASLPKNIALASSKVDYLNQNGAYHCHPYFWSGYMLQGVEDCLHKQKSYLGYFGIIFSFISLLLIYLFYRKRNGKSNLIV